MRQQRKSQSSWFNIEDFYLVKRLCYVAVRIFEVGKPCGRNEQMKHEYYVVVFSFSVPGLFLSSPAAQKAIAATLEPIQRISEIARLLTVEFHTQNMHEA